MGCLIPFNKRRHALQALLSKLKSYFLDFILTTFCQLSKLNISLDVTIPPTILCSRRECEHVVEYGKHFDVDAWAKWTAANDTMTGTAHIIYLSRVELK